MIQKLRLFGAYYWFCKQTLKPEPAKMSIPDCPDIMCKINPKIPEAEYWICLDVFGVRFVSVDSAVVFQRGFLFNEESVERILSWGAKQNICQLVVQTVNPKDPAA